MIFAAFVTACIKQCEGYGLDPRNSRVPYQLKLIILLLFFFPSKQQQMEYEMRIPKTQFQSGTKDDGGKSSFFSVPKMGRQIH